MKQAKTIGLTPIEVATLTSKSPVYLLTKFCKEFNKSRYY